MTKAVTINDVKRGISDSFANVKINAQHMSAFIIGLCFIDWMATYYFGRDSNQDDYKDFVRRFLRGYNADTLYHSVRCGLVHNYTERVGNNQFGHDFQEGRPKDHLKVRSEKGNPERKLIVLNLENFVADLGNAMCELFDVLESNPEIAARATNRFKKVGMIYGSVETE